MAPSPPLHIKDIGIIVGLDLVGDALIKLPFVRALRAAWPEARIQWITSKGPTAYNGPLRDVTCGLIDVVHEMPDWLSGFEARGSSPYFDLLIDTRNRWREAWRVRRSVPHGLFLATAAHYLISDRRPALFKPRPPHLVDRLLQLVELAAGYVPPSTGSLPVSAVLQAKARQLLPKGHVYVGFAPGAGNPVKIWPREKFVELAALQAKQNRVPVFLLGPQEEGWRDDLQQAVPTAIFPLQARKVWGTPDMTIEETLAIGSLLDAAVANDSGTGHMLAAVDCPLTSLFGPTSPAKLAPRASRGAVIRAQDFGGNIMDNIPVKAVSETVNRFVETIKILESN